MTYVIGNTSSTLKEDSNGEAKTQSQKESGFFEIRN